MSQPSPSLQVLWPSTTRRPTACTPNLPSSPSCPSPYSPPWSAVPTRVPSSKHLCRRPRTRTTRWSGDINMRWHTCAGGESSRGSWWKGRPSRMSCGKGSEKVCHPRIERTRKILRNSCKFKPRLRLRKRYSKSRTSQKSNDYQTLINNGLLYNFKQGSL